MRSGSSQTSELSIEAIMKYLKILADYINLFGDAGVEHLFSKTLKLSKLDWVHQAFLGHSKVYRTLKPPKPEKSDKKDDKKAEPVHVSPDPLIVTIKFVEIFLYLLFLLTIIFNLDGSWNSLLPLKTNSVSNTLKQYGKAPTSFRPSSRHFHRRNLLSITFI